MNSKATSGKARATQFLPGNWPELTQDATVKGLGAWGGVERDGVTVIAPEVLQPEMLQLTFITRTY